MSESPQSPVSLRRQLEMTRFEHAREVAESLAEHRALLTPIELARMNNILTGKKPAETDEAWRKGSATLTLPSGKLETFQLFRDPLVTTREKLHHATELAENGHVIDAAIGIYVDLVLAHVFEDANRRTAVLAAHYFFRRYNVPLSGLALHELGLPDLREEGQIQALRDTIRQMAKFAQRNKS
jgi:prophage maintenance system killer protein